MWDADGAMVGWAAAEAAFSRQPSSSVSSVLTWQTTSLCITGFTLDLHRRHHCIQTTVKVLPLCSRFNAKSISMQFLLQCRLTCRQDDTLPCELQQLLHILVKQWPQRLDLA